MPFEDRELRCASCGQPFVWTAGEQAYYADKGLGHEPRHCRRCKSRRPTVIRPGPAPPASAADTRVTCSQCGRPTVVPFLPAAGRPVFCRTCYHRRRASDARGPVRHDR